MKNLYNNKNLFDWIVWICIIAMMINVFFPFKGAFWTFVLMVFSIARYNNLSDKEIARLMLEYDKKDAELVYAKHSAKWWKEKHDNQSSQDKFYNTTDNMITPAVDNFQGYNSVQCNGYEKDLESPISKCKHCGMHEGFHWGKLTNHTKTDKP